MTSIRPGDIFLAAGFGFLAFAFASTFLTLAPAIALWVAVSLGYILIRPAVRRRSARITEETEK